MMREIRPTTSSGSRPISANGHHRQHQPPDHGIDTTNGVPIQIVAASLIREYLAALGYRDTLDAFFIDCPHRQSLITSKTEIAKLLKIFKAAKSNRANGNTMKSLLEVLIDSTLNPPPQTPNTTTNESISMLGNATKDLDDPQFKTDYEARTTALTAPGGYLGTFTKSNPRSTNDPGRPFAPSTEPTSPISSKHSPPPRPATARHKIARASSLKSRPTTAPTVSSCKNPQQTPISHPWYKPPINASETSSSDDESFKVHNLSTRVLSGLPIQAVRSSRPADINQSRIIEDVLLDFIDPEESPLPVLQTIQPPINLHMKSPSHWQNVDCKMASKGMPISIYEIQKLRAIVFPGDGSSRPVVGDEWKGKGFSFWDSYKTVSYGLVQLKGGPCGLLAAVQAFVVKHLAFGDGAATRNGRLRPTSAQCRTALVSALSEMIWQATKKKTGEKKAIVTLLPNGSSAETSRLLGPCAPDGITERLELHEFGSEVAVWEFIDQNLSLFTGNGPNRYGILLFLYSVVMSRGPSVIASEMDEPDCRMIGKYGYCTQEMVNLLILGEAVSNVFDGQVNLDQKILRGVSTSTQIGYLSLFEHYDSLKVGAHYKNPTLPIFIICSESHYTVLFSTDRHALDRASRKMPIDLFYYDMLAGLHEETRLTITFGGGSKACNKGDLTPPLEMVIRTKWMNCFVDWNGAEVLL
ncbi:hypothetical protein SeLEV6574_g01358 [Synchytrium endobioticum]|uniref:Probable ubiquitin carboxyl-terminal hydrolase MINDY-4 n=1 Tax=Synchytrium endobioticum TaxID=286115 RepID=A0A507DDG8_9FUNG|nr:hypothetical protein SeLEV6574_g01358 [Synchytrium endobioticum]